MSHSAGIGPAEAAALLARCQLNLRRLWRTAAPVAVVPASVAMLREVALHSVVLHRVLVVENGPDGEALSAAAVSLGKDVVRLVTPPGRPVDPAHLERFLQGPPIDTVALAHADRGTGAQLPLEALARVVRQRRGLVLLVDATGSVGATAVETDAWDLDCVLAPSEGAIGLPPGLAFTSVSPRLLHRLRSEEWRGRQLDLVLHHEAALRGTALAPVAPGMLLALDGQLTRILEEERLAERWVRHKAHGAQVEAWARGRGDVRVVGGGAAAVSCLEVSGDAAGERVRAGLAAEGWVVGAGVGPRAASQIRIGHQGDVAADHLAALLEALDRQLTPRPP